MSNARYVELEKVGVTFGQGTETTEALQPTSLKIAKGDFLALVGPSGCGKSTILKLISELLPPTTGNIFFGGRELGANPVRVGMAFQSASLLPWMSVRDNIMLPLKSCRLSRRDFGPKRKVNTANVRMLCWRRSGWKTLPIKAHGSCLAG